MSVNVFLEEAKALMASVPPLAPKANVDFRDLVLLLREPSVLFGDPCDESVAIDPHLHRPDWDDVLDGLYMGTTAAYSRCSVVLEMLQVAAQLLQESGHRILRGNPAQLSIVRDEVHGMDPGVAYGLQIDADAETAHDLNMALIGRLVRRDISRGGLRFWFTGANGDASYEVPEQEGEGSCQ
ncbi:hypothetical protein [Roseateles chitosanitabidus]|uniref:hypothetical protein n=1 Tax=Roseateles chitosanitabidus TaxID=65048 RepID=UPI0008315CA0|nr:hypothetical protein [Roseateles chitosanitabidus]